MFQIIEVSSCGEPHIVDTKPTYDEAIEVLKALADENEVLKHFDRMLEDYNGIYYSPIVFDDGEIGIGVDQTSAWIVESKYNVIVTNDYIKIESDTKEVYWDRMEWIDEPSLSLGISYAIHLAYSDPQKFEEIIELKVKE